MKTFLLSLLASATAHGLAVGYLYHEAAAVRMDVTMPQQQGRMNVRLVAPPAEPAPPVPPREPASAPVPAQMKDHEDLALLEAPPEATTPVEEESSPVEEERSSAADIETRLPEPPPPRDEAPPTVDRGDGPACIPVAPPGETSFGENAPPAPPPSSRPPSAPLRPAPPEQVPPPPAPAPSFASWVETGIREVLDESAASYLYPPRCIADGCDGKVRLRITVDPTGRVTHVDVASSSTHCAHLNRACVDQTKEILRGKRFVREAEIAASEPVAVLYDVVWRLIE